MNEWKLRNRKNSPFAFGLCGLKSDIVIKVPPDLSADTLSVSFGKARVTLPLKAVGKHLSKAVWQLTINVNTHLLENGTHRFDFSLTLGGTPTPAGTCTINVQNEGALARSVAETLKAAEVPTVFGAVVDSAMFPYAPLVKVGTSEDFGPPAIEMSTAPSPDFDHALKHMAEWGYAILPERLPADLILEFNKEMDEALEAGLLARHSASDRVALAHEVLASARQIWLYPAVMRFLREWFGDEPCACQTLAFINGSQQAAHQDTIHLTSFPPGYMCGVWVALEDISENSGELFVYPRSHKARRLFSKDLDIAKVDGDYSEYATKFEPAIKKILEDGGYEKLIYRPRAGEILVWEENLIHGGSRRNAESASRRSIVSHYFAKGSVAYYDSRGTAAFLEVMQ